MKATAKTTTTTAIPLRLPLASSLHPTSLHYTTQCGTTMNRENKPWRWGKRKEERNSNRFLERNDEDRRGRAPISLLFLPLYPLCSFDLGGGGAGLGLGKGGTVAWVLYVGPAVQQLEKSITFCSKFQTRHVDGQMESTRRALRNCSVCSSIRAMDPKS